MCYLLMSVRRVGRSRVGFVGSYVGRSRVGGSRVGPVGRSRVGAVAARIGSVARRVGGRSLVSTMSSSSMSS